MGMDAVENSRNGKNTPFRDFCTYFWTIGLKVEMMAEFGAMVLNYYRTIGLFSDCKTIIDFGVVHIH